MTNRSENICANTPLSDDDRWRIVMAKDRKYDGIFYTGVHTTGIYCRPSCAARAPKRSSVIFYPTIDAATDAGLRACKRCLPDQQSREEVAINTALRTMRQTQKALTLRDLARLTHYAPSHFQRIFTRAIGLSPAAFQRALRRRRANDALSTNDSVTAALYEAGYSGPSRFYDDRKGHSGMSASAWVNGGKGATIWWSVVPTSLGDMLVAATEKGVCRLSFDEGEDVLQKRFPNADLHEGGEEFSRLLQRVIEAVERPGTGQDIPLDVQGTAFQEAIWKALREIPPGETRSYSEMAAAVGKPKAVRAAGTANGANNIAVLIPCHRVVRSDGSVGGYAYGSDMKRKLLDKEQGR